MNYYLQTLTAVRALEGHRIEAQFADGYTAQLDLAPWVARGGIRQRIAAENTFAEVRVSEFGSLEWPCEVDLSPGTLRAWCEAGRVLTKDETDAWIAQHTGATQAVA